jgi:hypothetical protein
MQPKASEPVRKPSQTGVSSKLGVRRKGNAPDITAKSNPNKYPPKCRNKGNADNIIAVEAFCELLIFWVV